MPENEGKASIRSRMKTLRAAMDMAAYRTRCMAVAGRCAELPEYRNVSTVHIYISSINNEADTIGLIWRLLDEGKRVVVPVCADEPGELVNCRLESLETLRPGKYGIMEPDRAVCREVPVGEIGVIVAPVLAFDRTGGRLGFGGGYYDRLFAACGCPKVGLAYSFQEVEAVPREPHDRSLDIIVTDKETIRIR